MKTLLAITDLTRMQHGCVCVAGYDKDGRCVRPVLPPPGILESSLFAGGKPIVFPFAVVEYDLLQPVVEPPYLQITGVHTFPDYLQGKTFADLRKS